MERKQNKRAKEIIKCLKKHNGKTTFETLNGGEFINDTMSDTIDILEYLEDLGLVENMGNKLIRLTVKGVNIKDVDYSSLSLHAKKRRYKLKNKHINTAIGIIGVLVCLWLAYLQGLFDSLLGIIYLNTTCLLM